MKSLFHDCHWLNCKIWEIPWPQHHSKLAFQSTIIFEFMAITSMLWNFTKKPEKWKKHSVSIFVHFYPRKNVSTSDLSSSQITSVGKRNLGNISRPRRCLGLEKFFLGSFFLLRQKLGKTQIRRGQIFPGIKLDKYRNKILFWFFWLVWKLLQQPLWEFQSTDGNFWRVFQR